MFPSFLNHVACRVLDEPDEWRAFESELNGEHFMEDVRNALKQHEATREVL